MDGLHTKGPSLFLWLRWTRSTRLDTAFPPKLEGVMRVVLCLLVVVLLTGCKELFGDDEPSSLGGEDVLVIGMAEVFVADTLNSIALNFLGAEVTFKATQTDGQTAFVTGFLDEGGKIGGIGGSFDMYEGQEIVLSLEVHSGEIPSSAGGGAYVAEEWDISSSAGTVLPYARLDEIWDHGMHIWDPKVDFILWRR